MNHTTTNSRVPIIAILTPNTLASVGLRCILEKILPFALFKVCNSLKELKEINSDDLFHLFVSAQNLLEDVQHFDSLRHKTILLTNGTLNTNAIQGYHQINIQQSEEQIVRSIEKLHSSAHRPNLMSHDEAECDTLSPREIEVTKLLVEGLINKEIAERLGIGITTVITHRKNIFEKLGIRSIAGLTIYAIMKRYIEI